jgi:osmotically-inducible protein OsmY
MALAPTDQHVKDLVTRTIEREPRIHHSEWITVEAHHRTVTLLGTVETPAEKDAAVAAAWAVPEVKDVVDQIVIIPPLNRRDSEISADVRHALASDADINAVNVKVRVVKGTVFLRGTVPAYYQIDRASHDAWCVPGVAKVENDITVTA